VALSGSRLRKTSPRGWYTPFATADFALECDLSHGIMRLGYLLLYWWVTLPCVVNVGFFSIRMDLESSWLASKNSSRVVFRCRFCACSRASRSCCICSSARSRASRCCCICSSARSLASRSCCCCSSTRSRASQSCCSCSSARSRASRSCCSCPSASRDLIFAWTS
jgi:hypothetical protein